MLLPSGNRTPSFLIRDLGGPRRVAGEDVGVAALKKGFLMDLEKLCSASLGVSRNQTLGWGLAAEKGRPERRRVS